MVHCYLGNRLDVLGLFRATSLKNFLPPVWLSGRKPPACFEKNWFTNQSLRSAYPDK
jgi:hypothetical protein